MYTLTKKKDDNTKRKDSASNYPLHQKTSHFQSDYKHSVNRTGIPDSIKEEFERKIHIPLDDVRVHYQSSKPDQLHADAYTQGSDVYIAPGKEKYIRHELGHVLQQKMGMVYPTDSNINRDAVLEKNADRLANGTMQMPVWNAPYFSMGNAPIQMHPKEVSLREEAEQDVFPIIAKRKAFMVRKALLDLEMRINQEALEEKEREAQARRTEEWQEAQMHLTEEEREAQTRLIEEEQKEWTRLMEERTRITEKTERIQEEFRKWEGEINTNPMEKEFYRKANKLGKTASIISGFQITPRDIDHAHRAALEAGIQEAEDAVPFVTGVVLPDLLQEMHAVIEEDLRNWRRDRDRLETPAERRNTAHGKYRITPDAQSPLSEAEQEHKAYLQLEMDTNTYLATLSEEEKNALVAYTGSSYEVYNEYLRNAFGKPGQGKLTGISPIAAKLGKDGFNRLYGGILNYQSIFHGTGHPPGHSIPPVLTHTITVYRGKGDSLLSALDPGTNLLALPRRAAKTAGNYALKVKRLLKGHDTCFVEPGIMSTSKNPYVARKFAKGVILIIRVPAGKPVLAVTGKMETKGISDNMTKFEEEIVFPPRSVMRILSAEEQGKDIAIYCQMLP